MTRQLSVEKEISSKMEQLNTLRVRTKTFLQQGKIGKKRIYSYRAANHSQQTKLSSTKQTS